MIWPSCYLTLFSPPSRIPTPTKQDQIARLPDTVSPQVDKRHSSVRKSPPTINLSAFVDICGSIYCCTSFLFFSFPSTLYSSVNVIVLYNNDQSCFIRFLTVRIYKLYCLARSVVHSFECDLCFLLDQKLCLGFLICLGKNTMGYGTNLKNHALRMCAWVFVENAIIAY